jgi:hypothetical protein
VDPSTLLLGVGLLEVVLGLIVLGAPRIGGVLLALWLWAIIGTLASIPDFYDVMLRDGVLSMAALALAMLAGQARHERERILRHRVRPGTTVRAVPPRPTDSVVLTPSRDVALHHPEPSARAT